MDNKIIYMKLAIVIFIIIILFFGYNMWKYNNEIINTNQRLNSTNNIKEAYFAAGCFWCSESSFEKYKKVGVIDVISGYAGGTLKDPTYEEVGGGKTGHRESIKVIYDSDKINYEDLLQILWRTANPTDNGGQYVDRGFQYTSAIFYLNKKEKNIAISSKLKLQNSQIFGNSKIVTPIIAFTNFYKAEDYHQDYYLKNPIRYNLYTNNSGRKEFLEKIWGKELHYNLKKKDIMKKITINYKGNKLTPLQYKVTQEKGTERPFDNDYWDNKSEGIYVDIIDGTPLYSSLDKYESGTGWPSFTKPIDIKNIEKREDKSFFSTRIEIIGSKSRAHIGHVFNDGPINKGGLRYCMNSAAMIFISKEKLKEEGYSKYISLFNNK